VSTEPASFVVELTQREGLAFDVRFDWPDAAPLRLDEPPPLGHAGGPNAARLVAAAVANCLSASLLFCLTTKFHDAPGPLRATATAQLGRNDQGRVRIAGIDVVITLAESGTVLAHLPRCLAQFEDFCIVTQSVRHGIPVNVEVRDATGAVLAAP
jgi:organic hydroperoxide reductase OsmC/OhrA